MQAQAVLQVAGAKAPPQAASSRPDEGPGGVDCAGPSAVAAFHRKLSSGTLPSWIVESFRAMAALGPRSPMPIRCATFRHWGRESPSALRAFAEASAGAHLAGRLSLPCPVECPPSPNMLHEARAGVPRRKHVDFRNRSASLRARVGQSAFGRNGSCTGGCS